MDRIPQVGSNGPVAEPTVSGEKVRIPFNKPELQGGELDAIRQALAAMHLSGDGDFTRRCQAWLQRTIGCRRALLTPSCTAALEMAALLLEIEPGDEVVMPSFTFVSTANAFVLRGATPVFVDVRPDTLCIDEARVDEAMTAKTKAFVVVHYGGVGCAMDSLAEIAARREVAMIEDAAQAILASHHSRSLGSYGALATLSFHETKNVMAGEGGALLINDPVLEDRAVVVRDKGTNRAQFLRGETDKYTWIDLGSSYQPSEITAAFLWAQLEAAEEITARRRRVWQRYYEAFADLEASGSVRRPVVPLECRHNGHTFYLLLPSQAIRDRLMKTLWKRGIHAIFHYVPLHSSPAGRRYGRAAGAMTTTDRAGRCLVRLPLWAGMSDDQVATVAEAVYDAV